MSAVLARAKVVDLVRAISPTSNSGIRFVCADDATGAGVGLLAAAAGGAERQFDLRTATDAVDDGQAGVTDLRYRIMLVLRVAYPTGAVFDRERLDRVITEDGQSIITALRNPNNWDGSTTRIDTLTIGLPDQKVTRFVVPGSGAASPGILVQYPLTILYTD